jgi:DNA-binding XRE family transcriptional regulator
VTAEADAAHTFGVNLLAARCDREWTLPELAQHSGVTRATIRAVEDGLGCSLADAVRLALAVGVPLEQLLRPAGSGVAA